MTRAIRRKIVGRSLSIPNGLSCLILLGQIRAYFIKSNRNSKLSIQNIAVLILKTIGELNI